MNQKIANTTAKIQSGQVVTLVDALPTQLAQRRTLTADERATITGAVRACPAARSRPNALGNALARCLLRAGMTEQDTLHIVTSVIDDVATAQQLVRKAKKGRKTGKDRSWAILGQLLDAPAKATIELIVLAPGTSEQRLELLRGVLSLDQLQSVSETLEGNKLTIVLRNADGKVCELSQSNVEKQHRFRQTVRAVFGIWPPKLPNQLFERLGEILMEEAGENRDVLHTIGDSGRVWLKDMLYRTRWGEHVLKINNVLDAKNPMHRWYAFFIINNAMDDWWDNRARVRRFLAEGGLSEDVIEALEYSGVKKPSGAFLSNGALAFKDGSVIVHVPTFTTGIKETGESYVTEAKIRRELFALGFRHRPDWTAAPKGKKKVNLNVFHSKEKFLDTL